MTIRKIGDLRDYGMCDHPEHAPPNMIVLQPGVYEHICPGCRKPTTFVVRRDYSLDAK